MNMAPGGRLNTLAGTHRVHLRLPPWFWENWLTLMVQVIADSDMFSTQEMCHDAPEQPGTWRRTADANPVRAGLAVIMTMIFLEGPARAQSGTEPVVTIPVHPGTSTIFYLPDDVERVRLTADVAGLVAATFYDNKVIVRPQRGVPAGTEVTLAVKTATVKQRFRLRVVRHVRDAFPRVPVVLAERAEPAAPIASAPASVPAAAADPAASALINVPRLTPPAAPEPARPAGAVTTEPERTAGAEDERDAAVVRAPRFELSVHAVAALGTTELTLPGYEAGSVRQAHRALGGRLTVAPHGAWWAVEVNVSGERLLGSTVHDRTIGERVSAQVTMSGPRLRADVSLRVQHGTRWMPTAHVGFGLLAHYRNIDKVVMDPEMRERDGFTRDMPFGGVLALGTGLGYRAGDVLLGLEFQVRQGVPADYRSVAVLLSLGCFLDPGE